MKSMVKMFATLATTLWCILFSSFAHSEFYFLYNSSNQLISSGQVPPFDISFPPISNELQESKKRGEYLVIQSEGAAPYDYSQSSLVDSSAGQTLNVGSNVAKKLGNVDYTTRIFNANNSPWPHNVNSNYSTPGGPIQVRSYYRKDGTFVRAHTRSRGK